VRIEISTRPRMTNKVEDPEESDNSRSAMVDLMFKSSSGSLGAAAFLCQTLTRFDAGAEVVLTEDVLSEKTYSISLTTIFK